MAKELAPIERQITTPIINTGNNNAYAQAGQASSKLAEILSNKLTEQAVYQSGLAGQKAVEEGRAPENLAFPFTKATAAYNEAVVKTEARQLINSGRSQLLTAYAEMSNPATFNEQTPALFNARVQGITQGVLDTTRSENRGTVSEALQPLVTQVQYNMLNESIKYDNKQIADSFERDLKVAQEALIETLVSKDHVAEKIARENIEIIKKDYATLSQQIKNKLPDISKKIDDESKIANKVGDFLVAQDLGEGQKFISEFAQGKHEGLTTEQKYTALQKMIGIKNTVDSATSEMRAQAKQILHNDIIDPNSPTHIGTIEELKEREAYKVLTPLQQEQIFTDLIQANSAENNKAQKIAQAFKDISLGRAGAVDKSVINDIFLSTRENLEQQQGAPATLEQQLQIVKELGTNVPKFDQDVSTKLTSMNVAETLAAGRLIATMSLRDQENLISLNGEQAKVMGQKMATLLNGVALPQEQVVQETIRQVLKASDPEVKGRNDAAAGILGAQGPKLFKELFGADPDPFMDNGAYNTFKTQFLNSYSAGATIEEAGRITKNAMRGWSKSKYFQKDEIGQFAPEKELVLSDGTQNIDNQLAVYLDDIVKANNEGLDIKNGKYKMKILTPMQIPEKMNQADFIYNSIMPREVSDFAKTSLTGFAAEYALNKLRGHYPLEIEYNGIKSDVVLKSSTQTRAAGPNPVYGVFAKDGFGIYQQLPDPRNPDGLAYVVLKDIDQIAPELFEAESDERIRHTLDRARGRQLGEAIKQENRRALEANPWLPEFKFIGEGNTSTLSELKDIIKQNQ